MSSADHQRSSDTSKRRIAMISGQLSAPLTKSILTIRNAPPLRPARPNAKNEWKNLPKYKELPKEGGFRHAWKVWGEGDQLGTVNLLTDEAIRVSAAEEIRVSSDQLGMRGSSMRSRLKLISSCCWVLRYHHRSAIISRSETDLRDRE